MKNKKAAVWIFTAGLLFCSFPLVSEFSKQICQKKAVSTYENEVTDKKEEQKEIFQRAREYNRQLFEGKEEGDYKTQLGGEDQTIMGTIEIPGIHVCLPIYHGTSKEVLSKGAGHLRESSLPSGGKNTRCVLTGHRGLPNAKLFTRLDELKKGDQFFLRIYGKIMAYEVKKIQIIEPSNLQALKIEEGKDLVSLLTCTPYGINTQRLVVTGERIPYKGRKKEIHSKFLSPRECFITALPFLFLGMTIIDDLTEE